MEFISQAADLYVQEHSTATSKLLQEIHDFTYQHHVEPHMLSGPVQGKFLSMVSRMIKPKRILEIGTFTGYSSICLAEGLAVNGLLHTIEMREADAEIAHSFFNKSEYKSNIQLHVGDAHQLISSINEDWDLVFIDADKTGYIDYFNFLNEHVRAGTFLLFDNVLFHGEVFSENIKGKSAKAIAAFNEHLKKINNIDFVMLTIRDGITIIQKK